MVNHYDRSEPEQEELFRHKSTRQRIAPTNVHKLVAAEQFKLMKFVESNYVTMRLNDDQFAVDAEKSLGFKVTKHNVSGARRALGVESTVDRKARENKEAKAKSHTPQSRLDLIEARLAVVEAFMKEFK